MATPKDMPPYMKFEAAWYRYITAKVKADELRAAGRRPRKAVMRARKNLEDVCKELGVECPVDAWS